MAHTYTILLYHIVFSTKERLPWLDESARQLIFPYMAGIIENVGGHALLINGVADHVHILCRLKPKPDVSEVIKKIKGSSSKFIHDQTQLWHRSWQEGYGAFTVSFSQKNKVHKYIQNQEAHHKKKTFAEEYEELLIKHEVEYDRRYFLD